MHAYYGCGKKVESSSLERARLKPRRASFSMTYGTAGKPCPFKTPTLTVFPQTLLLRLLQSGVYVNFRSSCHLQLTLPRTKSRHGQLNHMLSISRCDARRCIANITAIEHNLSAWRSRREIDDSLSGHVRSGGSRNPRVLRYFYN